MARDIIAEAHSWQDLALAGRNNASEELREALGAEDLTEEDLVWAYNIWWGRYTEEVNRAPKEARSGGGISSYHARAAGRSADEVTLRYLAERSRG